MGIREILWGNKEKEHKKKMKLKKLNALPTEKEIDKFGRRKGEVIDINGKRHKKGRVYRGPNNHE